VVINGLRLIHSSSLLLSYSFVSYICLATQTNNYKHLYQKPTPHPSQQRHTERQATTQGTKQASQNDDKEDVVVTILGSSCLVQLFSCLGHVLRIVDYGPIAIGWIILGQNGSGGG
jgi:hypothetical protein